jgi:hypothetical protein
MQMNSSKRNILFICLLVAPLLQLLGDSLWINGHFKYSWSIYREASYIFFIPVGLLLAKVLEPKTTHWAIATCALFIVGCFGSATMMPLFRLGAFYPIHGHNEFPSIVQDVQRNKAFALTLFPPGLCFPVSLLLFGIAFIKYRSFHFSVGIAFIIAGILFWLGNAMEINAVLVLGDAWLLALFVYTAFFIFKEKVGAELSTRKQVSWLRNK